jgi:hypothetical protein
MALLLLLLLLLLLMLQHWNSRLSSYRVAQLMIHPMMLPCCIVVGVVAETAPADHI